MMTGIQNVNSLEAGYYAATLIFIGWFALYDFRRHLVRNQALAIFFFWCLLSLPLTASTSLLPVSLLILQAVMGFLNGGLILLAAAWITHGGIGGGDIKLAALLGLLFGTRGVCLILFIAAISALAFVLLISGRNRSSPCACPLSHFFFWVLCCGYFYRRKSYAAFYLVRSFTGPFPCLPSGFRLNRTGKSIFRSKPLKESMKHENQ